MSPSTFSRAVVALGLLTSTVSGAFSNNSKKNVAVYWGQGGGQAPLSELCANPSVDIVNIAFVNEFPQRVGEYPKTNHGNACWGFYPDPITGIEPTKTGLSMHCAGVEKAIIDCQAAGKKVLLSLGGGAPTNYYLPSPEVARYFAEFLVGAYGPVTPEWTAAKKPRPFGAAVVDGFDLDLEAEAAELPSAEYIFKNYDVFGNRVKAISNMLLSAAPQCIVPDSRASVALKAVPFDFVFVQFYNTNACSARLGLTQPVQATTGFSFTAWANWLAVNSANKSVKLYIGLPAGTAGVGAAYANHYLKPDEANSLIAKYQSHSMFGGIMLWEATVSANNKNYCKTYDYWVKSALENTFSRLYKQSACVTSSSVVVSSTKMSSSKIASSTPISSTKVSSSKIASSTPVSSTKASSSKIASSTPVSSTKVSSSKIASSTPVSSTKVSSSKIASSTPVSSSKIVSSTKISSSAYVSSTAESSSAHPSSSKVSSSSAVHVSSSAYPASSSIVVSSSAYIASSSVYVVSSSVYDVSNSVYVPHPTESSSSYYPSSSASVVYPVDYPTGISSSEIYPSVASSAVYPVYNASSTGGIYPTGDYPGVSKSTPEAASSTPCTTSSIGYTVESSSVYSVKPAESSKGGEYPVYPTASSKGQYIAISSTGKSYDNVPSITKGAEYPSQPTDATTTVVTTTYVDTCSTGLTTLTTTIVKTVCNHCAKPTDEPEVPEGWTTSVYVSKTLTVTLTKPVHPATDVPAYPSAVPKVYPAEYPSTPKPSSPSSDKPETPVYEESYPEAPAYPAQSGIAEYPKKPVEGVETTSTVVQHVTLTKVAAPYTPAPYPSAPSVPVPAHNGTAAYAPLPTGTGKPTKPSSYSPPEFEGAATRFSVGLTAMVGVVATFLIL